MAMMMIADQELLYKVVEMSRKGLQAKTRAERRKDGIWSMQSRKAWGRITPRHQLGHFWRPGMLGEAEKKWKELGPDGVWWPRDEQGEGRTELTTRPDFSPNLFGDDRDTGRNHLVNTKVCRTPAGLGIWNDVVVSCQIQAPALGSRYSVLGRLGRYYTLVVRVGQQVDSQ